MSWSLHPRRRRCGPIVRNVSGGIHWMGPPPHNDTCSPISAGKQRGEESHLMSHWPRRGQVKRELVI